MCELPNPPNSSKEPTTNHTAKKLEVATATPGQVRASILDECMEDAEKEGAMASAGAEVGIACRDPGSALEADASAFWLSA